MRETKSLPRDAIGCVWIVTLPLPGSLTCMVQVVYILGHDGATTYFIRYSTNATRRISLF